MANEVTVTSSITIRKGNGFFQPQPQAFTVDLERSYNGPTPGAVTAQVNHTVVVLTQLTALGGWCRIRNLDAVNKVYVGVYSAHYNLFLPLHEVRPGEHYVARLADQLGRDLVTVTGTGLADAFSTNLALKADVAPVVCTVEAFDP